MTKKIGILTSGGDCPGLNAAIGAVTIYASQKGYEVLGIRNGTRGLMGKEPVYEILKPERFTSSLMYGRSTFLGTTNKGNPFKYPLEDGTFEDRSGEIIANIKNLGIDTLIGIGGDGSLYLMSELAKKGGFNLVWIPKTIDNDVHQTELAIGFYSAVRSAMHFVQDLQATAETHGMIMVTEIMGRDAGHLALHAGLAASVDIILIPEINYSFDNIVAKCNAIKKHGRNHVQLLVSEAVKTPDGQKIEVQGQSGRKRYGGIGAYVKEQIEARMEAEIRVQSPGHTLRGCAPTANDIILAQQFGLKAVDLIMQGKYGRMVSMQSGDIVDVPVEEVAGLSRGVDVDGAMVHTARGLGISFGDE